MYRQFRVKDGRTAVIRPVMREDAGGIIHAAASIVQSGIYIQKEQVRTLQEEEQLINEVQAKKHMYAVVELEGEITGIARLLRGELKMKHHVGLFRTWLISTSQGLGIGREVMDYTIDWGKSNGLVKICLTVFKSNQKAVKLYENYGFIQEGVQKKQVWLNGAYDDEIHMARFLS